MVTEKAAIAKLFGGQGTAKPKSTGPSQWHRINLRAFGGRNQPEAKRPVNVGSTARQE
jgi:hypothetical protein